MTSPQQEKRSLFHRMHHVHTPRNVNEVHASELESAGFNKRVAIGITKILSSMVTFWLVGIVITVWILVSFTSIPWDKMPWPLLLTLLNIPQISMMIGLGVGQGVLGRKQELQADEQYRTTMKTYHDIEQVMQHLEVQDSELIKQTQLLNALTTTILKAAERRDANL